jgi:hypothetical protein
VSAHPKDGFSAEIVSPSNTAAAAGAAAAGPAPLNVPLHTVIIDARCAERLCRCSARLRHLTFGRTAQLD